MTSRKEREGEWRRKEILKAAEMLFAKQGFFKTAMADISKASEFPLATIYKFFSGKENIYHTLINVKADRFLAIQKDALGRIKSAKAKLKALAEQHLKFFEENRDFLKIYISERSGLVITLKDDLHGFIQKKHEEYVRVITEILKKGIERREFKKVDPLKMAVLMVGALDDLTYRWITEKNNETLSENLEFLLNVLFTGIERSNS